MAFGKWGFKVIRLNALELSFCGISVDQLSIFYLQWRRSINLEGNIRQISFTPFAIVHFYPSRWTFYDYNFRWTGPHIKLRLVDNFVNRILTRFSNRIAQKKRIL